MIRIFCDICGKDKKCDFSIREYRTSFLVDKEHICQECYAEKLVPMFLEVLSKRLHDKDEIK